MDNKKAAIEIIKRLHGSGYEALLAGGCVRDMLLGRAAKDYDVATSAEPIHVIRLFKKTIKVGAHFGVVIVIMGDQQVEVATFRSEFGYEDGRHPDKVEFVCAEEDALRRDFTINGMFYDPLQEKVIDYVGGQKDLKAGLVRTIGDPNERFGEDYLRMLRAVRFSTQLEFPIEPNTWKAIIEHAGQIVHISGERKQMEIESILTDPHRAKGAAMLIKSKLAEVIFPEFVGPNAKFAIKVLSQLKKKVSFALAIAALFSGFETKVAMKQCVVLRLSRACNKQIKFLLSHRGYLLKEKMTLAELRKIVSEPYFEELFELQRAIQDATYGKGKNNQALVQMRKRINELGDLEMKPKPLLNGHDLIALGALPGPMVGQLAEELYIAQLDGQIRDKQQAQQWAEQWLEKRLKRLGDTWAGQR